MMQANVEVEVLESHIAVSVPTDDSEGLTLVGDANQVLIDHPNEMVNQWRLMPDTKVPGVVWIHRRCEPLQLFYCGPGVTCMPIDQSTLENPAISTRLPPIGKARGQTAKRENRRRLVDMPFIGGLYVRRLLGHVFYARRLLTSRGTFTSSSWGVQHLESGLSLFECADDCAASALRRVLGQLSVRKVTAEQLDKWVVPWLNNSMMTWDDYVPLISKAFGEFDRMHHGYIKARKS